MDRGGVEEVQVSVAKAQRKGHNTQIYRKGDRLFAVTGRQTGREIPGVRETSGNGIPPASLSGEVYDG